MLFRNRSFLVRHLTTPHKQKNPSLRLNEETHLGGNLFVQCRKVLKNKKIERKRKEVTVVFDFSVTTSATRHSHRERPLARRLSSPFRLDCP
jgi:hypothetical protein